MSIIGLRAHDSGIPINNIMRDFLGLIFPRLFLQQTFIRQKTGFAFGKLAEIMAFLMLIVVFVPVGAQTVFPQSLQISADERAAALKSIREKFQALYVIPEMRSVIIARLDEAQRSGRYDVADPYAFAERITRDLKDVAHDEHLALFFDLPAYKAALAPPQSDDGELAFRRRRAIRINHGITEMRILPGNIRYVKIAHFEWVPKETSTTYDTAMRFLKDGDAWIIDLRSNGGGTSSAADYFLSFFHDPGTVSYIPYVGYKTPKKGGTVNYPSSRQLKGKLLYLLIDGGVGSAAEAVAYDLQQYKIAKLIGSKTVGAANNNKRLPIAPGFILSVSYTRPLHTISKTNWEGIGVKPDVECGPGSELDMAESLALKHLADAPGVSSANLTEYNWARTAVEARLHPVTITPVQLKNWSGRFGNADYGEMQVIFINNTLWLERPGRPRTRLSPLTADGIFAIEGSDYLRVRLSAKTLDLFWWEYPNPRIYLRL